MVQPYNSPRSQSDKNERTSAVELSDPVGIISEINKYFPNTKAISPGKWSAVCPMCGDQTEDDTEPERKLLIVVDSETGSIRVRCFGDRCAEGDLLQRVGIAPEPLGLQCTDVTPVLPTPAALLRNPDAEISLAIEVLENYFPEALDDPYHRDPHWVACLQRFAKAPAFYSALVNLMTQQRWPRDSRDAYLAGHNIMVEKRSSVSESHTSSANEWPEPSSLPDLLLAVKSFDYALLPDILSGLSNKSLVFRRFVSYCVGKEILWHANDSTLNSPKTNTTF